MMSKPRDKRPTGLPKADPTATPILKKTVDRTRHCKQCGQEGRVVSNSTGVNVYCGPCKIHWPISATPYSSGIPITGPRGLRKETIVEPDWNIADEEDDHVTVGPKRSQ